MEKTEKKMEPQQIEVKKGQGKGGSSNLTLEALNIEVMKKDEKNVNNMEQQQLQEPQSSSISPMMRRTTLTKPSRSSCLCSPTTHVGSFRCRFHRVPAEGMTRGYSVGSNLSELAASKSQF